MRSYYDEIYIFVLRQIDDEDAALDLTQDIFIAVLQSISAYKREVASFRTWLYRIATNKIIDYRKRYLPIIVEIEDVDVAEPDVFMDIWMQGELLRNIEKIAGIIVVLGIVVNAINYKNKIRMEIFFKLYMI